jgi:hypothetical protein
MILRIFLSLLLYFAMMFLSVNLLGLFVRGLFVNTEIERLKREGDDFIKKEIEKSENADKKLNLIAIILIIIYLFALFYFWNIGVVLAAIMIMGGRLPDLIWEIKNGKKMTRANAVLQEKNFIYFASAFLPWLAFPVLYYFLNFYK